jgi:hypothetical protein
MTDFTAAATALAARYASAQMTAPTGYKAVQLSTFTPPEALPPLPCVFVFAPESGSYDTRNGTRTGGHDFMVRFYYDQAGDMARQAAALLKWMPVLFDQLRTSVSLSSTVVTARLESYKTGYITYAGLDYAGVEMTVRVVTSEDWSASG